MTRRIWRTSSFARALGIALMVPSLLQLPLPQLDFHVVRHQHEAGQVCAKHDHLLRWHPQAGEGRGAPVLHWHWLLPKGINGKGGDPAGRPLPLVHAHDGDHERPISALAAASLRESPRPDGRGVFCASLGLDSAFADRVVPQPPLPPTLGSSHRGHPDGLRPATVQSFLVRWNC